MAAQITSVAGCVSQRVNFTTCELYLANTTLKFKLYEELNLEPILGNLAIWTDPTLKSKNKQINGLGILLCAKSQGSIPSMQKQTKKRKKKDKIAGFLKVLKVTALTQGREHPQRQG